MSEQEQREMPAATPVTPGVWLLPSQGNGFAVETPDGVIAIDTGPGGRKTDDMIAALRAVIDAPACTASGIDHIRVKSFLRLFGK